MAKSTIMGAKTSTGIGHNTELNSFLIFSPSPPQSRCHREGFRARRSLPFGRSRPSVVAKSWDQSSHCQTTSALSPSPGPVCPANGTRYRRVCCQSQSFSTSHKSGDLRHTSMLRVGIEVTGRPAMQATKPGVAADGDVSRGKGFPFSTG